MRTLDDYVVEAGENARDHGFHDTGAGVGDLIALLHTELSEAYEDYRAGHDITTIRYEDNGRGEQKPVGFPIEVADVAIRLFDMCYQLGINLEEAVCIKMAYNKTRPHRHGGKIR